MRILLIIGWLLVLVGAAFYHFGPGQHWLHLDNIAAILAQADRAAANGQFAKAVTEYDEALKMLPSERKAEMRQVRLEKAKVQMLAKQLPAAHQDLMGLVDEMKDDPKADPKVLAAARSAYANAQYYMTWLMRLEGLPREAWEPEIEAARQTYRLLAEQATQAGDDHAAGRNRDDLESAIRLARLDLGELQGLALPCQCSGCCSGRCRSPGKKEGKQKNGEKKDARQAGSGPPPDGSGH
jgi:hypothetical protein